MKHCRKCGLRVFKVLTADGRYLWIASSCAENPRNDWGRAVCRG